MLSVLTTPSKRRKMTSMCELLAISSDFPVTTQRSLIAFAEHGGHNGPHRDGWSITYYQGNDIQLIREARAAADSEWG
jgi:glutamine amidotransferase